MDEKKLYNILHYSIDNVLYYKKLKLSINPIETVEKFPIIDKRIIKDNYSSFISNEYDVRLLKNILHNNNDFYHENKIISMHNTFVIECTTGSSGMPFSVVKTIQERNQLARILWKKRNEHFVVSPNSMFNFIHNFDRIDYPFPFEREKDSEKRLKLEFDYLLKKQFNWWHINQQRLSYYAICQEKLKYNFGLQAIENNGSFISKREKDLYSKLFNCRIIDHYGCREIWTIAYDCPYGFLHINSEALYFELVDDDGKKITENNIIGNIVITSYIQKAMPIIRYRTGDIGYYIEGECICGNKSKRIKLVPNRNKILGTDIYGNDFFKSLLLDMIHKYHFNNFNEIRVVQTSLSKFIIIVLGIAQREQVLFEKNFKKLFYSRMNNNYILSFKYNENCNGNSKSFFTVKL